MSSLDFGQRWRSLQPHVGHTCERDVSLDQTHWQWAFFRRSCPSVVKGQGHCDQKFCEHKISWMQWGIFVKFGTNLHSDSRRNWFILEVKGQRDGLASVKGVIRKSNLVPTFPNTLLCSRLSQTCCLYASYYLSKSVLFTFRGPSVPKMKHRCETSMSWYRLRSRPVFGFVMRPWIIWKCIEREHILQRFKGENVLFAGVFNDSHYRVLLAENHWFRFAHFKKKKIGTVETVPKKIMWWFVKHLNSILH